MPGKGLRLQVLVQPNASISELAGIHDGRLKIRIAAPAVEGKANEALIRFLARKLAVPKSALRVAAGGNSRRKSILALGLSPEDAMRALGLE
jgi:uncharacterized protein (TIGR00251 family)